MQAHVNTRFAGSFLLVIFQQSLVQETPWPGRALNVSFLRWRRNSPKAMSIAELARLKLRKLAASVAIRESAKEAAVNIISAPVTPAEECGKFWLGFCVSLLGVHLAFIQIPRKEKNEDKMTELVEEVRVLREEIKAGFDKVVEAKEAELKMMKVKENKSWIRKFW